STWRCPPALPSHDARPSAPTSPDGTGAGSLFASAPVHCPPCHVGPASGRRCRRSERRVVALGACPRRACSSARSAWGREGMGRRRATQRRHAASVDLGMDAHDGTVCRTLLGAMPCGKAQAHAPLSVVCVPVKDGKREAFCTGSSVLFRTWKPPL